MPQAHVGERCIEKRARKKQFARAPVLQVRVIRRCEISRSSKTGTSGPDELFLLAASRRFRGASVAMIGLTAMRAII
jgi:hypothetical protein